ncbi:MAG: lipoyl(octanoyl) transferase LipB [Sphingomonadaceae bacterium]|nr:lipoyl(octanoyl) transferase LipB [Sphingomonadaceae bacterium]
MTLPEWRIEPGLTDYAEALAAMETRVAAIRDGSAPERIWLVEHPPVYTAGTSAIASDLVEPDRFPVFSTGRGGQYTYHGPGQRVGYVMLDLERRGRDIRCFVDALEEWMIAALARFDVAAFKAEGRVGVWTSTAAGEAKIGAIGVRVRRWVSFHGFALNVAPDLSHFDGIVPCGLPDYPVTSLAALGVDASLADLDDALAATLPGLLGRLAARQAATCR